MYYDILALPPWVLWSTQSLHAVAMLLACVRIVKGPRVSDRIIALDLLGSLLMAQFVLLVFRSGFVPYLNVAAVVALISFIATVAFARYLQQNESDT